MTPHIIVQGSSIKYAELPPKRSIHNPDKPTKEYQKAIESAIEVHPGSVNFVQRLIYPINGYAPGLYSCICGDCERVFHGDKRAVRCPECAEVDGVYPIAQAKVRIVTDCANECNGIDCKTIECKFKQYAILEPENSAHSFTEGSETILDMESKVLPDQLPKEFLIAYSGMTEEKIKRQYDKWLKNKEL